MKKTFVACLLFLAAATVFAEVTESTWKALLNSQVTVVKNDGSEVRGKLTLIESASVSIIKANGEVVTVRKRDARSVKADAMRGVTTGSPDPGWARGAAIFGYAAAGTTLVVGIVAAIVNDPDDYAGLIVGGIDYLIAMGSFPVVAVGGSSALGGGVIGSPWMRIVGWIAFGLAAADGIVEIALGASGLYLPSEVVLSTVILATAALAFISTDALIAAGEAEEKRGMHAAAGGGLDVAVLPLLKLHRRENSARSDLEVGLRCRLSF
jgi:hypothetical protein